MRYAPLIIEISTPIPKPTWGTFLFLTCGRQSSDVVTKIVGRTEIKARYENSPRYTKAVPHLRECRNTPQCVPAKSLAVPDSKNLYGCQVKPVWHELSPGWLSCCNHNMLYRGKANKRTHLAPFGSTANLSFCKTHEKAGFFFFAFPSGLFWRCRRFPENGSATAHFHRGGECLVPSGHDDVTAGGRRRPEHRISGSLMETTTYGETSSFLFSSLLYGETRNQLW